jgi:hypothetical protein
LNTTEDRLEPATARLAAKPVLALVFTAGEVVLNPSRFPAGRKATAIGREAPPGGIALPGDPRVSRRHAALHADVLGQIRIVDQGSRNGVLVNRRRVPEALLGAGDVVQIGDSFFVVSMDSPQQAGPDAEIPALIGCAPVIRRLRAALARIAATDAALLLLGESGSGKDVAARALHDLSGRRGPFVAVNCSAIPEALAESQLFGHVGKAFTGAEASLGLFRAAAGGTLFLDEVGDLPMSVQPKLLRVLQDHCVRPLGQTASVAVDVRIVAATNRDLGKDIEQQRFRGDLYARLAELPPLEMPALRDRREDILLLLAHSLGLAQLRLDARLVEALLLDPWTYNVRALMTVARQVRMAAEEGPYDLGMVTMPGWTGATRRRSARSRYWLLARWTASRCPIECGWRRC